MSSAIEALKARMADVNAVNSACAIMEWDQQTYMPRGASGARAHHIGILSRMAHDLLVSDETKKLIEAAQGAVGDPDSVEAALVRVTKRNFELSTKIPSSLVEEKAQLSSVAHEVWVESRKNNDFKTFAPYLKRMFEIARQEADALGYKDHVYDALLDQYEEGATAADAAAMFETLKQPTIDLVNDIRDRGLAIDDSVLYGEWSTEHQKRFTEKLIKDIGFDMNCGRQDTAPHPFCTNFSISDVRLTTRYKSYIGSAIFGSLHEAGHGMYEQGSPMEWDRTPLAGGVSLGVHESQSRLWENIIGRSRAFWRHYGHQLHAEFPSLAAYDPDQFYRLINKVEPSLIRVEADEVTYNMHVAVRFEIECDVLTGALKVEDVPEAWNAKYENYLGIRPPNDSEGCLQDVHWSMGSIGYFPTYSMGNLLSYQIWRTLQRDLGDTDALIEAGNFKPILSWLQEKVYRQGQRYTPKDLVKRVTGRPLSADDYVAGLREKYNDIYVL